MVWSGGIFCCEVMTAHFAGSSHPEWGYLAPGPSFVRTARVALVACAVGATAGAGVVASLIDRPPEGSVAARTLVQPIEASAPTPARTHEAAFAPSQPQRAVLVAGPASGEGGRAQSALAGAGAKPLVDSQTGIASAVQAPAELAAVAVSAASGDQALRIDAAPVAGPAAEATTSGTTTSAATPGKKAKTKHSFSRNRWRGGPPDDYALGGASRWAAGEAGRTGYYGPQQAWGGLR
jgi:hypothetical protein